ncbi:MAG: hypothetical protein HYW49_05935 [Deltaproteobacteria bacterium]|nr:hypothetical protein [Deltaproteobacteria bacterium]
METPSLISALCALILWGSAYLVLPRESKTGSAYVIGAFGVAFLGCVAWTCALAAGNGGEVAWTLDWAGGLFASHPKLMLRFGIFDSLLWLGSVTVIGLFLAQDRTEKSRAEAVGIPLLGVALTTCAGSTSLMVFFFGMVIAAVAGFVFIAFGSGRETERSEASARYLVLMALSAGVVFSGILGLLPGEYGRTFAEIASNGSAVSEWALLALVAGSMFWCFHAPFLGMARALGIAGPPNAPAFVVIHAFLPVLLMYRLQPLLAHASLVPVLAAVSAVSTVAAAALTLLERETSALTGWLCVQLTCAAFMSAAFGAADAGAALGFAGMPALLLFAGSLPRAREGERASRLFLVAAAVILTGGPLSALGWAKQVAYAAYFTDRSVIASALPAHAPWIAAACLVLSDLIVGVALWGIVRDVFRKKKKAVAAHWTRVLPLAGLLLCCLSLAAGGPPFSGLLGEADYAIAPSAQWLAYGLFAPDDLAAIGAGPVFAASLAARLGSFALAFLIGFYGIFRDPEKAEKFLAGCHRLFGFVGAGTGRDIFLWKGFLVPVAGAMSAAAGFLEETVPRAFARAQRLPRSAVKKAALWAEDRILDQTIVGGLGEMFQSAGKALRFLQTGQVQFYFAAGILLMGIVVARLLTR